MHEAVDLQPTTPGQEDFERAIDRRLRLADTAARLRAGGIQVVWIVVVVAGAAVPFAESTITEGWVWVTPALGFVVVVAAGLERIFRRTTSAAVPLDQLRRAIASERRMLQARGDVYGEPGATYALFAERVEGHIAEYDRQMITHARGATVHD